MLVSDSGRRHSYLRGLQLLEAWRALVRRKRLGDSLRPRGLKVHAAECLRAFRPHRSLSPRAVCSIPSAQAGTPFASRLGVVAAFMVHVAEV